MEVLTLWHIKENRMTENISKRNLPLPVVATGIASEMTAEEYFQHLTVLTINKANPTFFEDLANYVVKEVAEISKLCGVD